MGLLLKSGSEALLLPAAVLSARSRRGVSPQLVFLALPLPVVGFSFIDSAFQLTLMFINGKLLFSF